ncbi:MAG: hypothetical protein WC708_08385 [Lentisphaeria bacterium]
MANGTNKPVRTPYEKGWWCIFTALIVCFVVNTLTMTNSRYNPGTLVWFFLMFTASALLGLYSLALFKKLPVAMTIIGAIQGCLFGFNVLGRFLFAWIAMMTT